MANFNKRFGGSGGKPSFGGNRSGKPAFFKKSWGNKRSGDGPVTLHKATCAECGKPCEVPFRPTAGKPVYCKDCFSKKAGYGGGDRNERGKDRFPKRDFAPRGPERPRFESGGSSDIVSKQLEAVNAKLERLIRAVEGMARDNTPSAKAEPKEVFVAATKKVSRKKTVKK